MTKETIFLSEATRCLFSSMEAEVSLCNFFRYVQQVLPVTGFYLSKMIVPLHKGVLIAKVTDNCVCCEWKTLLLSAEQKELWTQAARLHPPYGVMQKMVTSEDDPLYRFFSSGFETGSLPMYFIRLVYNKDLLGSVRFLLSRVLTDTEQVLLSSLETPFSIVVNNLIRYRELERFKEQLLQDNKRLRHRLEGIIDVDIIGQKGGLAGVMQKVRMSAPVDVPVLISGETGTGKELIARAIHEWSSRKGKNFVPVNCGAIPPGLVDSELFGHVKGAFTGANAGHKGRFERADNGTLFLDEVGELPLEAQSRLLRVLETGEVERIGGTEPVNVDIRLIAATHRDLAEMVRDGTFREDLYYRLRVVNISVPPLRRRKQDIPLLVDFLLNRSATRYGMPAPEVTGAEMDRLLAYDWPGNVRELQNILEESLVCSNGEPLKFSLGLPRAETSPPPAEKLPTMDEAVRDYLVRCLHACRGRVDGPNGAARVAGLTPSTFRFRCRKLHIAPREMADHA
jgi:transcriptional regulator with GAF, ATPase, and Fis domain